MPTDSHASTAAVGILLAFLFVAIRGCNSANYIMARGELPDLALVAVSALATAVVAFGASLVFERADWGRLLTPYSLRWTLSAGSLTVLSVFVALRSFDYIPPWLTQSFIGLEPAFATLGLVLISMVVSDQPARAGLLQKLPENWWFFGGGLVLVILGVVLMTCSKTFAR